MESACGRKRFQVRTKAEGSFLPVSVTLQSGRKMISGSQNGREMVSGLQSGCEMISGLQSGRETVWVKVHKMATNIYIIFSCRQKQNKKLLMAYLQG